MGPGKGMLCELDFKKPGCIDSAGKKIQHKGSLRKLAKNWHGVERNTIMCGGLVRKTTVLTSRIEAIG